MLAPPMPNAVRERALAVAARAAILVEGWSDHSALQTLAMRRGYDLNSERILVVPTGGVTNVGHFAAALGPQGIGLRLAGLYDAPEQRQLGSALRRAAMAVGDSNDDLEALGFFACDADLEDELIRALGASAVERLLDGQGELDSFRVFQSQPAQRGRSTEAHLRRFIGTRSGRKIRYGTLLVASLPLDRVPQSLDRVLVYAQDGAPRTTLRTTPNLLVESKSR
jgi:hypothetical protein